MKRFARPIGAFVLVVLALSLGWSVYAQVKRPYRNGSVWDIAFIRMKPGMETAYLTYVANEWKREQEALKKGGVILSYRVIASEPHNPGDFNLMLMTEFKDLASMEANESKAEQIANDLVGGDQKMQQGYKERLEIREVLGSRLGREIVLDGASQVSEVMPKK